MQTPLCRTARQRALKVNTILVSCICCVLGCDGNSLPSSEVASATLDAIQVPSHEDDEFGDVPTHEQDGVFSGSSKAGSHKASHRANRIVSDEGLTNGMAAVEATVSFENVGRATNKKQAEATSADTPFLAMRSTKSAPNETGVLIGLETADKRSGKSRFQHGFENSLSQSGQLSINAIASVEEKDHNTSNWIPDFSAGELAKSLEGWSVDRVQLVSVIRRDRVRVYGGKQIPAMKALKQFRVSTRPATSAELSAVESLRVGESHVLSTAGETPLLISALVAKGSCLHCHNQAREGDLMGALAIRFTASESK